jgi:hypothetical protein
VKVFLSDASLCNFEQLELKLCEIVLVAIIMIDHTEIQITGGSSHPKEPWATEEAERVWVSK